MDSEERLLEALETEDESEEERLHTHHNLERKNRATIDSFLGNDRRVIAASVMPRYYGELLTWALHRLITEDGWRIEHIFGYKEREPVYLDVGTDYGQSQNLMTSGQLLLQKDQHRFVVTVDINLRWGNRIQVEGPASSEEEISQFVAGLKTIASERNIYRGKKCEFGFRIRFLDVRDRSWDSVILQEGVKQEIEANTTGFLKLGRLWESYGIPPKRGVLLAGDPGTGKTIIGKALMAKAEGVSCLATSAYALADDDYITELYELAQDIAPCIVFIEDIDLIGQDREEHGHGAALMSLLAVMDGLEEHTEIVTVATTNCLETLDKALSQRPSRFDRVIKLTHPSLAERRLLVGRLCEKIPLAKLTQDYIARQTEGCTPAQVQEVVYGLAIAHAADEEMASMLDCSDSEIDRLIARINCKNSRRLGFKCSGHEAFPEDRRSQ